MPRHGAGCTFSELKKFAFARTQSGSEHGGCDAPPTSVSTSEQVQQAVDLVPTGEVLGEEICRVLISSNFAEFH